MDHTFWDAGARRLLPAATIGSAAEGAKSAACPSEENGLFGRAPICWMLDWPMPRSTVIGHASDVRLAYRDVFGKLVHTRREA